MSLSFWWFGMPLTMWEVWPTTWFSLEVVS